MSTNFQHVISSIGQAVYGKEHQIKLSLACILAGGHLLIEDLPGMGKTTLAHALARVLGLDFERVQFTSDLLPGDILGVSIYETKESAFRFVPGPVFTHLLLADEINRSTPKTQSALLEVMEEKQVTVEGTTRQLDEPFFVIATQNPMSQAGTYPLPESQLDRFLMCISLGYPNEDAERRILMGEDPRKNIEALDTAFSSSDVVKLRKQVEAVNTSEALIAYVQRLVGHTRDQAEYPCGLSPRGAMGIVRAAKAWAFIHDREFVSPEDVQAVLPFVVEHRIQGYGNAGLHHGDVGQSLSQKLLRSVNVVSA